MNLIKKGQRQSHRGVIGVESAIVMIAFVIVAAALAFVVLNMGFTATQKAKTAVTAGIADASRALEVSGKVTGYGCTSSAKGCTSERLNVTAVPLKLASGGDSIVFTNETATIKYVSNAVTYDNIFCGVIQTGSFSNTTLAFNQAKSTLGKCFPKNPITQTGPAQTKAMIYWALNLNNNTSIDTGEHPVLAIAFTATERPKALDTIRVELVGPTGAPLTIERNVPSINGPIVDLG